MPTRDCYVCIYRRARDITFRNVSLSLPRYYNTVQFRRCDRRTVIESDRSSYTMVYIYFFSSARDIFVLIATYTYIFIYSFRVCTVRYIYIIFVQASVTVDSHSFKHIYPRSFSPSSLVHIYRMMNISFFFLPGPNGIQRTHDEDW